ITANETNASYQWLDCDNGMNAIVGATNQSFTATEPGNYAVAITQNGCTDTSSCVTLNDAGLTQINNTLFRVYPIPTSSTLTIVSNQNLQVDILDLLGKKVGEINLVKGENKYNVQHLTTGVYYLKTSNGASHKFIKE
ncbi:MAG TPA: T9SS type A sorting domain-containing protein, partial [Taishania sp.]|nr:T9SS type A sorting domain-containing protein [Taishania sp.]